MTEDSFNISQFTIDQKTKENRKNTKNINKQNKINDNLIIKKDF